MPVPSEPKIYHILHVDRLSSVVEDGYLWCDAEVLRRGSGGTTIGMSTIKKRRLQLPLRSHPSLHVGRCVPFNFCPRSVMLYLLHRANHEQLAYRGGQEPIVHLEADLRETVAWAQAHGLRWAFTLSNAGSYYFRDRADLARLDEMDWEAVQTRDWQQCKETKQAEFLLERQFPWTLVSRVGVLSRAVYNKAMAALTDASYRPRIEIRPDWYY